VREAPRAQRGTKGKAQEVCVPKGIEKEKGKLFLQNRQKHTKKGDYRK